MAGFTASSQTFGNIFFKLKPVETGFPAVPDYQFLCFPIETFIHRFEKIGKPVFDKLLLRLKGLKLFTLFRNP
jgi:hypothetical protein